MITATGRIQGMYNGSVIICEKWTVSQNRFGKEPDLAIITNIPCTIFVPVSDLEKISWEMEEEREKKKLMKAIRITQMILNGWIFCGAYE